MLNGGEEHPPFRAAIPGKVILPLFYPEELSDSFTLRQNTLGGNHTRTRAP
jgi:hypothetical protein